MPHPATLTAAAAALLLAAAGCATGSTGSADSTGERPPLSAGSATTALPAGSSQSSAHSSSGADNSGTYLDAEGIEAFVPLVVAEYPMAADSFTQGLAVYPATGGDEGALKLLVGTGLYGHSRVYVSSLDGRESAAAPLESNLFGEGVAATDSAVWQLTWKSGTVIKRDLDTLAETDRVKIDGQGWGLCHDRDGGRLVASDGSSRLFFRDPDTFALLGEPLTVTAGGKPVERLNELDCSGELIWANIWQSPVIAGIDPSTGEVVAKVDVSALDPATGDPDDVANGIARIPSTDRYLLTGKRWGVLYEVRLVPAKTQAR